MKKLTLIMLLSFMFMSCSTITTKRVVQNFEKTFEKTYTYDNLFDSTLLVLTANGTQVISTERSDGIIRILNTTILLSRSKNGVILATSDKFDESYEFYDDVHTIAQGAKDNMDEDKAKVTKDFEDWKQIHESFFNNIIERYKAR